MAEKAGATRSARVGDIVLFRTQIDNEGFVDDIEVAAIVTRIHPEPGILDLAIFRPGNTPSARAKVRYSEREGDLNTWRFRE